LYGLTGMLYGCVCGEDLSPRNERISHNSRRKREWQEGKRRSKANSNESISKKRRIQKYFSSRTKFTLRHSLLHTHPGGSPATL
jgi:iron only hydrogenase large subunit-like protein